MRINQTYERLSLRRVRVLALVAEHKTIREIADELECSYNGARSLVRDLRGILDCADNKEMAEWWGHHAEPFLGYVARSAGLIPS